MSKGKPKTIYPKRSSLICLKEGRCQAIWPFKLDELVECLLNILTLIRFKTILF